MIFTILPRQKKRIDLLLEPIKTGDYCQELQWRFYDDFKINPHKYPLLSGTVQYNSEEGEKTLIKNEKLTLKADIKGV